MLCKTTNGVTTKYVYGRGLIGEEASGAFKTYHFDCRGSTVAITDACGNITDTFAYDTYGKVLSRTGTSKVIFGYNGRDGVVTDDNGLIYMRARYYSPEMKRFINADIIAGAISNAITLNRYAYANGNPVSFIDPFGLSAWSWLKDKYNKVKKKVVDTYNDVKDCVVDTYNDAKKAVSNAYRETKEWVTDTYQDVKERVVNTYNDVKEKVVDTYQDVKETVIDTYNDVKEGVQSATVWVDNNVIKPVGKTATAVGNWLDDAGKWLNENARNEDGSYALYDNQRFRDSVFHEQILAFTPSAPSWNWSAEDLSVGLGSLSVDAMTGGWEGEHANLSLLDFGHAEAGLEIKNGKLNVGAMASIWSPAFAVDIFGCNIEIGVEVGAVGLAANGQFSAGKKEVGFKIGGGIGFSFNASW